jgi:hypothetical protein
MPQYGTLRLEFPKLLEEIKATSGHGLFEVWRSFLTLTACYMVSPKMNLHLTIDAIARNLTGWSKIATVPSRTEEMQKEMERWEQKHLLLFGKATMVMLEEIAQHPYQDILGAVHQEWMGTSGQQWGGEFHTPHVVSQMMARLTFNPNVFEHEQPVGFHEPACGAGQLVLSLAEVMQEHGIASNRMVVEAWDVSQAAVDMCLINFSTHAIPARIVRGNTLSMKINSVYQTLFYPLAIGNPRAEQTQTEAPTVVLKSSRHLEGLLAGQGSLFTLEMG